MPIKQLLIWLQIAILINRLSILLPIMQLLIKMLQKTD